MAKIGKTFTSTDLIRTIIFTMSSIDKETQDAIWNDSTLIRELESFGAVDRNVTGDDLTWPVEMAKNTTVDARSWATSVSLVMQDLHRMASEDFAQYTGAVVLDEIEMMKNAGAEKIINYSMTHIANLRRTMIDKVNTHLHSGSGTFPACIGLATLIPETNNSATLHGISQSSYSWWRNQSQASACSTTNAFGPIVLREVQLVAGLAGGGQGKSNFKLAVTDDTTFANAIYYLPDQGTIRNVIVGNGKGQVNWPKDVATSEPTIHLHGARLIWDHAAPADALRLFNPEYVRLRFLKNGYFRLSPKQQAEDSWSVRVMMGCAFQFINKNPRRSAVIYNFNA